MTVVWRFLMWGEDLLRKGLLPTPLFPKEVPLAGHAGAAAVTAENKPEAIRRGEICVVHHGFRFHIHFPRLFPSQNCHKIVRRSIHTFVGDD